MSTDSLEDGEVVDSDEDSSDSLSISALALFPTENSKEAAAASSNEKSFEKSVDNFLAEARVSTRSAVSEDSASEPDSTMAKRRRTESTEPRLAMADSGGEEDRMELEARLYSRVHYEGHMVVDGDDNLLEDYEEEDSQVEVSAEEKSVGVVVKPTDKLNPDAGDGEEEEDSESDDDDEIQVLDKPQLLREKAAQPKEHTVAVESPGKKRFNLRQMNFALRHELVKKNMTLTKENLDLQSQVENGKKARRKARTRKKEVTRLTEENHKLKRQMDNLLADNTELATKMQQLRQDEARARRQAKVASDKTRALETRMKFLSDRVRQTQRDEEEGLAFLQSKIDSLSAEIKISDARASDDRKALMKAAEVELHLANFFKAITDCVFKTTSSEAQAHQPAQHD